MGMSRLITLTEDSCQPAVTLRQSIPACSAILIASSDSSGLLPPRSSSSSSPQSRMMIGKSGPTSLRIPSTILRMKVDRPAMSPPYSSVRLLV